MIILAIETSCDETSAAVVQDGKEILSNIVASSLAKHAQTGGIIPEVAAREQVKCMIPVIEEALRRTDDGKRKTVAGKTENNNSNLPLSDNRNPSSVFCPPKIDAIAVTVGPGLIGSLLVGVETAKTLSYVWNKPIIPVNHLCGHIYANWLEVQRTDDGKRKTVTGKTENGSSELPSTDHCPPSSVFSPPKFPALALVVSGGHTELVLMENHGKLKWLGGTRDDAAGECFDKCARLLGLSYPGGPAIAEMAQLAISNQHNQQLAIKLPRPMINEDNFDFSFSGLKTAVLRAVENLKSNQQFNNLTIQQLSYEIQEAITDVLVAKTMRAAQENQVKSILLAGGVAANSRLREKFQTHSLIPNYQFLVPLPSLCTDNAAYIASCAFFNNHPKSWQEMTALPGLEITDRV